MTQIELTLKDIARLEAHGVRNTPMRERNESKRPDWTVIENRHDGRSGVVWPTPEGLVFTQGSSEENENLVQWWDGPFEFDVVPSWYLVPLNIAF